MITHGLKNVSLWTDDQVRALTPSDLELSNSLYESALRHLFDRPIPKDQDEKEWYWNADEPEFAADDLSWVKLQTLIFARCGKDLQEFTDQQVGLGLDFLVNNSVSNVPHAVDSKSVSLEHEAMLLRALPLVWTDCFSPRFNLRGGGIQAYDYLQHICFMWFDVWPSFWNHRSETIWKDGVWRALKIALQLPCINCQRSALHGIGHDREYLERDGEIDQAIDAYMASLPAEEGDLLEYALSAKNGCVQ